MSDEILRRANLCVFSKAAGGGYADRRGLWDGTFYEHLDECPLGLRRKEAPRCPCKLRVPVAQIETGYGQTVTSTVSTCLFPKMRDGKEIYSPEALVRSLRLNG
jgi:hypothetical protein